VNIRRILKAIIPPPRHKFDWFHSAPLVLFLLLFAASIYTLERTDTVLFTRPNAFGLIAVSVWLWWLHLAGYSGLSRQRAMLSLWVRFTLAAVFVMVLAEPRAVKTRDVISVVYALDVSDSIGDASVDAALEFVAKQVQEKPEQDEAGLVVFGGTAAVELPPRTSFPFEGVVASRVQRDATNIEQSLSLAAAMLPEENRGRIVLISDGTSTGGNLTQLTDELKSRGVTVDVLPIEYQYDREVWIERLELPQYIKLGQDYAVTAILSSLQPGSGKFILRENGEVITEETVVFNAGKNQYQVPIRLPRAGYYEYQATIEVAPGQDNLRQNNTVLNFLFVDGEGKVLVVTDPAGDERDADALVKAIEETDRLVERVTAFEFPHDTLSLMPYDCVVWVNTPSDSFDEAQMDAIHDAVRDLGTGFLMVGGPNSFGPGGYHRTSVEKALPVSMDVSQKKVLPKGALVVVLHTCEFPEGNTWGKRITKQAIKVLTGQDEVGVLVYGNGEEWLFKLTPAADYDKMVPKINNAQIGDMPSFAPTMQMALTELKKSDAAAKHVIIISDGDPSPPAPAVLAEFKKQQITISTVAVFPHGGVEISTLRYIATSTGGRYYFPSDPNILPSIFIKEAKTLKRTMIQEKEIFPQPGIISPILKGVESIAALDGYVLTSLKPGAEAILETPPGEEEGQDEVDPILARWRYGLGSSAAFTSDLSTRWGKNWLGWDKFKPIVKQLMTDISRVREPGRLRLWTYASGGDGVVMVEDFNPDYSFLEIAAVINGPDDLSETIPLRQVTPRRYQARVPLWGQGRYQVIIRGQGDGRDEVKAGGFIVPYSPEYLRFRSNPVILEEIREKTGGELLTADTTAETIFGRRDPKQSSSPIFDWFLIALAILIPLDVAIRRIQIDWYVVSSLFQRKQQAGPATATMGTLLQRKQDIGSRLDAARSGVDRTAARKASRPATPIPGTTAGSSKAKKPAAAKSAPTPAASGSTTGKLLAMKRKRQQDEDG
jgi:uncharacterized membrane protein